MTEHSPVVSRDAYERLQRDYQDASDKFDATQQVLAALGRSSDPDTVLDTVVASARRLCQSDVAQIYLVDGDHFVIASAVGQSKEFLDHLHAHPMRVDRATLVGRVVLDRTIQQIADVLSDPAYGRQDVQAIGGYRTLMSAPLLLDDHVVGVMSLWRNEVDPFDDRAISLVEAFAAQAAVVVRNVHLVRELESRGAELALRVDQLEALHEVGETVSSSLVVSEVLSTIIMNAVRFSGCDGGSIMEYVPADRSLSVRAAYATSEATLEKLRRIRVDLDTTLVGRAATQGQPIAVADLTQVDMDPHLQLLVDDGWRSLLAVPMLRGGRVVGALVVRRKVAGDFPPRIVDFLVTFASQSALAVSNAQIFRELEEKRAELEVVSQHKSEFLASMSHELRTPLNAVIGFSEVLLDRLFGDLNERQEEYIGDILSSGRHLLELLNDILDLSKVEAGRMVMDVAPFSLGASLTYAISMVRERALLHGIELSLENSVETDIVSSDELRFRQVVLNLLSNAVKFTHDGGHVVVRATENGDEISVSVTDDGAGIPEEDRDRIFESFQQGSRGTSKEEGTGLGLTLCRRIVGLLGGRLWLETEYGVGSTFGFTLPIDETRWRPTPAEVGPAEAPVVVVVDDDRASLDLMSAYLEGEGVRVIPTRSGEEGLMAVEQHRPAGVVLDIRLPGLDGWEVLSQIRARHETRHLPVVIASILDEQSRGRALGADAYLIKPVGREELTAALRRGGVFAKRPAAPPDPPKGDRQPRATNKDE
jgi:signal transduction histidine kinase/ActR/RegA family two-component response regulator